MLIQPTVKARIRKLKFCLFVVDAKELHTCWSFLFYSRNNIPRLENYEKNNVKIILSNHD